MKDTIVVLDFGGQYAHLIANRVRRLNVYSEIMPCDTPANELEKAKGIILSGGPSSVYGKNAPKPDAKIFSLDIPILGLCYGHQLMAHSMGGEVKKGTTSEYGRAELEVINSKDLFKGLAQKETVWMSHGDTVVKLPPGFAAIGKTDDCEIAAMGNGKYFGLQFHPEVTHTPNGMKILSNFVFEICGCRKEWTVDNFIDEKIKDIKKFVGDKNVFLLVSGGVDSTVCFTLLTKAIGEKRVYGLHIDNGFMRRNESSDVKESLKGYQNLHVFDASDEFLDAVKGVVDPEEKRKIIGTKFIEVANGAVKDLDLNPSEWILGQGTIYPDTIETKGTKHADLIKTHHNRVELVQQLIDKGMVIEPISQLYKDEVRELGLRLGIPENLIWRHPFPGPGLSVRALCIKKPDILNNAADVEKEIDQLVKKYSLKSKIMPLRSVGVQGDARTYRHPVVLIGKADWGLLDELSTAITNKFKEINRVLYLITPKKIESLNAKENSYLVKDRLDVLREADYIAMETIRKRNLLGRIWQMPVVLLPVGTDNESIVLRPVYSKEAMTAEFAKIPMTVVEEMAEGIAGVDGIDAVFYDITNKPPGTIEWE